ncbi:MAG: acetoacetate decarboxylase [Frankiales bacterium]|nr:acetoacetate decarboxylase [Frankiales bacterium]
MHQVLGQTVAMPVLVRDASAGTVIFDVDLAAAQALVPGAFEVIESAPGKAQLALALVDYRDNDLGAYHEVGTIFFVRPAGGGPDGNYISHLPVDQEFTCAAGNQIWGFPKTVESIEVTQDDSTSRWVLTMDGELVLDVTVPRGGVDEMPRMDMLSYTLRGGVPCSTAFAQGGTGSSMSFDGVTWELGTHPIAKELESLGLSFVMATWIETMQATFEDAVPLS